MKKVIFAAFLCAAAAPALASDFCRGFEMGYRTVAGNFAMTPICPVEPITPIGSSGYQEGLKVGMEAAR